MGLTGLTSASSGLIISTICDIESAATTYTSAGSTIETIATLGAYVAPTAGKCRFREVDATNHKGLYEFQFADARFAVAKSRSITISVSGATTLLDTSFEIDLVQYDPFDSMRLGLNALPNAASGTSSGLPISSMMAVLSDITAAVPTGIKKNTAITGFTFLMVDTSGNPKTGLSVTAQVSLNGASFVTCTNAVAELALGYYKINLAAADLNADAVTLRFTATGAVERSMTFKTES
jgi:hypothetical protein